MSALPDSSISENVYTGNVRDVMTTEHERDAAVDLRYAVMALLNHGFALGRIVNEVQTIASEHRVPRPATSREQA